MVFLARDFRAVLFPGVKPDTAAVGILQDEHESERRHDLAGMGDAQRIEMLDPRPERLAIGYIERDRIETPRCLRMLFAQAKIELGAEPGDIASAVRFLLGPDARWVSGTTLSVDGGASGGTTALPQHWPTTTSTQQPTADGPGAAPTTGTPAATSPHLSEVPA